TRAQSRRPGRPPGHNRLFPALAPLEADEDALLALGEPGGACDGGRLSADAAGAAGWPFFAQFVAHDVTANRASSAGGRASTPPGAPPRANLDCVYAGGPAESPFLYQRDDPAKLLIGANELGEPADLPRNAQGVALIGDPRNDAHLFTSQ